MSLIYLALVIIGICLFSIGYVGQFLDEVITNIHKNSNRL